MTRSVPEWIGKTDNSKPPGPVVLRIWRREDGICHLTGRKIASGENWHLEHKIALSLGGKNVESNIFPALIEPHKEKSADEAAIRAKADAVAKRHVGITRPVATIKSAPMPVSERTAKRQPKAPVPGMTAISRRFVNG